MHCYLCCYHYICTVYVIYEVVASEANWYCNRAPQSAPIAKSILEDVNLMLSEESGYRSATDAEFAELMWGGLSRAGAEVSPQQGHKRLVTFTFSDRPRTFPQEL